MFYQLTVNNNTIFYDDRKPEAATAVWRASDDGHCNARNMLRSICTTKAIKFYDWLLHLVGFFIRDIILSIRYKFERCVKI
jgi:hypothetical protein